MGLKAQPCPISSDISLSCVSRFPNSTVLIVIKQCMCRSHSSCLSSSCPTKGLGEFLAVCFAYFLLCWECHKALQTRLLVTVRIKEKVLRFINSVNVKNPKCETSHRRIWTGVTTKCDLRYKITW